MPDYYTSNPSALLGKPKSSIADYVQRKGILVPKIYTSLDEAIKSGKPFILRSEHPHEYDGASGIFDSFPLSRSEIESTNKSIDPLATNPHNPSTFAWKNFEFDRILAQIGDLPQQKIETLLKESFNEKASTYAGYIGLSQISLLSGLSYSYWELLGGFNRSIIADSSIPEKYHLFTTQSDSFFHNYTQIDNGNVIDKGPKKLTHDLLEGLEKVIDFYQKIRMLDRFDKNHCPLIEFQTLDKENFFLQYHRTRDFSEAAFTLGRMPSPKEQMAHFVRGATPPSGIICKTSLWYPNQKLVTDEDASFDFHNDNVFTEIMSRKRKVQLIDMIPRRIADCSSDDHLQKSRMFNPSISLGIRLESIMPREEWESIAEKTFKEKNRVQVPLHIVSDGKNAYVEWMK